MGDATPGWSTYTYCYNNPLRIFDPDGQTGWDVLAGIGAAVIDNVTLGAVNLRDNYQPTDASDYNTGQDIGDVGSAAMGLNEVAAGSGAEGGGVVIAVGSGGTAALAGAAVTAGGAVVQAHGAAVTVYAGSNFFSQKGRIFEAKRTEGGIKTGKEINNKEAQKRLKEGKDTYSESKKQAKKIQKKASNNNRTTTDKAHGNKEGYKDHVHDEERLNGHSFYGD